jgi:hypothetical protein
MQLDTGEARIFAYIVVVVCWLLGDGLLALMAWYVRRRRRTV